MIKSWIIKKLGGHTKQEVTQLISDCGDFFERHRGTDKLVVKKCVDGKILNDVVIVRPIEITNGSHVYGALIAPWAAVTVTNGSTLQIDNRVTGK